MRPLDTALADRSASSPLPDWLVVLERGWLSSNNIVLLGEGEAAIVDSGYGSHASQTVALVEAAIGSRALRVLANTHLHSDHCGGNAALQARFPDVVTLVPPGQADQVRDWNPVALTYAPTGQQCPAFHLDGVLAPGTDVVLAGRPWSVLAAPGHDPHSVILFERETRTLLSADALWERGFGIVFPELEGERAFDQVEATLDLIESLGAARVVPGHGSPFTEISAALSYARRKLAGWRDDPRRHASHAAKVLVKFKLLDWQRVSWTDLQIWAARTAYFGLVHGRWFDDVPFEAWVRGLGAELERSGAARAEGEFLENA